MRERRAAPTAGAVAITAVAGAVTAVVLAASATPGPPANELAILLAVVTYAGVALVVEHAHPGHRVGRLMLGGAAAWGVGEGLLALGLKGYVHDPGGVPGAELLGVLGTALRGAGWWVLILAVPLVFPDGRRPWPGRRAPVALVVVAITTFTAATLLAPQPLDFRLEAMDSPTGLPDELAPLADVLALFGLGLCIAALVVAVAGLAHRWRTGGELRRQQLLWLCVAFAAPVMFLPIIATEIVDPWMFAVVVIPVPVAIAVAILQRRLYDVQLAVTRTLTWLGLSTVVALLYALTDRQHLGAVQADQQVITVRRGLRQLMPVPAPKAPGGSPHPSQYACADSRITTQCQEGVIAKAHRSAASDLQSTDGPGAIRSGLQSGLLPSPNAPRTSPVSQEEWRGSSRVLRHNRQATGTSNPGHRRRRPRMAAEDR